MAEMDLNYIEEIELLTEEQWERILAWHRKRMGRLIAPIQLPVQIDPTLPSNMIKIGDVTFTNIKATDDHSHH